MEDYIQLQFIPPINHSNFGRLSLKVNLKKTTTVEKLRKKVANKLNYFTDCIILMTKRTTAKETTEVIMEDKQQLKDYNLEERQQITIILTAIKNEQQRDVQRLIVGGIDLTDKPEFKYFLKKKTYDFVYESFPPANAVNTTPIIDPSVASSKLPQQNNSTQNSVETISTRVGGGGAQYYTQMATLRSMGFTDENKNIATLIATNGDLEQTVGFLVGSM